ncbi:MAG: hypothetical protein FD180_4847 [Planctomycetota bacterium]|nr:MAG: hypothetical protein FD180_4847 [Planctomycetota bacterium]
MRHSVTAVFLFFTAAASAQETVDLKLKLTKGQSWKVELSADMTGSGGDDKKEPGIGRPLVKDGWSLREAWMDVCEADAEGLPTALKRTWSSAKVSMIGRGGEAAGQEGATAKLEAKADEPACTVTVSKGKLPRPVEDFLAKGPIEPLTLLLPAGPVKPNEEWKVSKARICQFHRLMATGIVGGIFTSGFDGLLKDMKNGGEAGHGCEVSAKITAVTKTEATIEFAGAVDDGNGKVEIKGSLKWIVTKNRPSELTWSAKRENKANDELGTKAWREEWKFAKNWK